MNNLKKPAFYLILLGIVSLLSLGFSLTFDSKFYGDYYVKFYDDISLRYGGLHFTFNVISLIILIISTIFLLVDWLDVSYSNKEKDNKLYKYYLLLKEKNESEIEVKSNKKSPMKKILYSILSLLFIILLFNMVKPIFVDCASVYNKSKIYNNNYIQKVQEKKGFYDKLWKTYLQKEKITNINKETFLKVTSIIMENRRDGEKVTWKWLQENQQIPYSEFTSFYSDLSDFITSQREGYFNIEKECQQISNSNNTLLDTFPNNLYNKFLKCKRIKFEYGFTSDHTDSVFISKKEN